MDRSDFYYKQNVTQAEMDQAFDDCENADRNIILDRDEPDELFFAWGVLNGYGVNQTATPSLSIEIADGVAYDEDGRRIPHSGGPYTMDLTSLQPGSDQRYVRIYAEFTRDLSDSRVDGLGAPIDYRQAEGVIFSADAGAISASPVKPTVLTGKVLLATVLMVNGLLVTDARISMGHPTATDAVGDRQPGGFAVAHGRQNPTSRKILYASGLDEVIDINGNSMRFRAGAAFMDRGAVHRAKQVQAEGPPDPASGVGFLYVDPASADEYGDLYTVTKYASWPGSAFHVLDDQTQGSPWTYPTPPDNSWYVDSTPGTPPDITYKTNGWKFLLNTAGAYQNGGIGCPLVGLLDKASLNALRFHVFVQTVEANVEFAVAVYRFNLSTTVADLMNTGGTVTFQAMPGTGVQAFAPDAIDPAKKIIRPDLYAYYAVFYVRTTAAKATVDAGIVLHACSADMLTREASGVY